LYTAAALKSQTVKDLGKLATKFGVVGWRGMRKDELVKALVRAAKRKAAASAKSKSASKSSPAKSVKGARKKSPVRVATNVANPRRRSARKTASKSVAPKNPRVARKIQRANADRERDKNLAVPSVSGYLGDKSGKGNGHSKSNGNPIPKLKKDKDGLKRDRVVLLVRDAYWLQAWWELTRQSMDRAKAAMAEQWHTAKPMIRLVRVEAGGTTSSAEQVIRDIPIHGGVKTWYIDVKESPKSYRVDIGFLAPSGKFFSLARSNSVTTPRPSKASMVEEDWSDIADNCEQIYALSGGYTEESNPGEIQELLEDRLGRPVGLPAGSRYGVGAEKMLNRQRDFEFVVDAEIIIFGTAKANSHVTLAGTPVKLSPDGSFSARLSMPDRRQVLPIVAASSDGVEKHTVVLAIERNTKVMEPQIRESGT
jgi:hypothetical protein